MLRISPRSLCALLVLSLAPACQTQDGAAWRTGKLFEDGLAEYAAYEIIWPRYGEPRGGRALMVLVREPWAPDLNVKADTPRSDGFDVLKLNHIRDVRTGIYNYHQMASAFVRRDDGRLHKLVTTSSEACGTSGAVLEGGQLETRSYFDGQGLQRMAWPEGAVAEDALPILLRDYVAGTVPTDLSIVPSLLAARFPPLTPVKTVVRRVELERFEVPAGSFKAVAFDLGQGSTLRRYVLDAQSPHPLLAYEAADGTRYRLAKIERLAYWNRLANGDESWWPESLR